MRAARGASLKTIKFGGLSGVLAAGRRMDALGMSVNLASKMADSNVPRARQSCISAPRCRRSTGTPSPTCQYLRDDIVKERLRIERGHARASDRPGLGVAIDEDALARFEPRLAA